MKKHVIAALLVIAMCLAVLAGCSMRFLEKDVKVTLDSDGENLGCYTVSTFNNAIVPRPEVPERFEGLTFIGWTAQENWEELNPKEVKVSANKELIRYDDVKDYVKSGSITLYAAFVKVDLVVAWYDRHTSGTDSGLNDDYISAFRNKMYAYLTGESYSPEDMFIDIRSYSGTVAASCEKIMKDADVDIMIGWGGNIKSTGGIDYLENKDGITIGSVSRYAARITDTELSNLVFNWIKTTYGASTTTPEPDDDVDTTGKIKLVIGWYSKTGTSGLSKDIMDAFEAALKEYLATQYNLDDYAIIIRDCGSGGVASIGSEIKNKGDYDLIFGMGNNISTDAGIEIEPNGGEGEYLLTGVNMGNKTGKSARNIAIIKGSASPLTMVVWNWLIGENKDGWLYSEAAKTVRIYIESEEA